MKKKTTNYSSHPLEWPAGEPRTPAANRKPSRFDVDMNKARKDLFAELRRLGADDVVLSTNQERKRNGEAYANDRPVRDPGAACYWSIDGKSYAMACDIYTDLRGNIRAIGKTVEALRSIERYGSMTLRDRAFTGFAALPANAGADGERPWRDVMGFPDNVVITTALIDTRYRELARKRHPDMGGSESAMAELNRARDRASSDTLR